MSKKPYHRASSPPAELICQNPNCKKMFIVPYNKRYQKYCSRRCHMKHQNDKNELLTEKWLEKQRTVEARLERSERMISTNKKMKDDPYHIERRKRLGSLAMTKANETMRNDPYHIKRRSEVSSRNMKRLHQDKEFKEKRIISASKVLKTLWADDDFRKRQSLISSNNMKKLSQDPEFIKKRDEAGAKTIRKNHQNGVFGKAQRLLYEKLNSSMPGYFGFEVQLLVDQSMRDKYGCNHRYYMLDIPFMIDGVVIHNFEIDGKLGHSTDEDKVKDSIRDEICLNEYGFPTNRITNREVFVNVHLVSNNVLNIVKKYII